MINNLLLLAFYFASIGTKFHNNGDREEGKWKDGKKDDKCKKSDLFEIFLECYIVQCFNR